MKKLLLALCLSAGAAAADPVEVVDVVAVQQGDRWRFDVTLRHPDTGWDHYADGWVVEAPDGTILANRPLAHPHVDEQPFTRSVSNVRIWDGVTEVTIRASCSVDGWTSEPFVLQLPLE